MSEDLIGLLVALGICLVSSLVFHAVIRRYLLASVLAAFGAAFAFQMAQFLHLGYLDPFFLIAFVTTSALGFVFALVVGLFFIWLRTDRSDETRRL